MKLWKGRFSKAATSSADEFNASIEFDQRLYKEDITGSIAHAKMLAKQGIIPQEDADLIVKTLKEILADIEAGKVEFTIESEDIHMNIESILTERIGDAGKKLHTARSRNDQIAVDIRLYLKKEIAETDHILGQLLDALAKLAKEIGTELFAESAACHTGLPSAGLLPDVLSRPRKIRRLLKAGRQTPSGKRSTGRNDLRYRP